MYRRRWTVIGLGTLTCAFRPHDAAQMEYRALAITITLKMTVAIPATSMVKARVGSNGMRHSWQLSSDGSGHEIRHDGYRLMGMAGWQAGPLLHPAAPRTASHDRAGDGAVPFT